MKNYHKVLIEILRKNFEEFSSEISTKIEWKVITKSWEKLSQSFEKRWIKTSIFCEVSKLLRETKICLLWEIQKFLREGNFPKYKLHRERELGRFIVSTEIDDENFVHIQYKKDDIELEKSCDKAEVSCG